MEGSSSRAPKHPRSRSAGKSVAVAEEDDAKKNNSSGDEGEKGAPGSPRGAGGRKGGGVGREQDLLMPIANVVRIMRKILPAHAKIADDAKETIQTCVSEYINFVTASANDRCRQEQRKTVTAEDVLWAMSRLGFDDHIEFLTLYLHRYRELEGDHRGARRELLPRSAAAVASAAAANASAAFFGPQAVNAGLQAPQPLAFYPEEQGENSAGGAGGGGGGLMLPAGYEYGDAAGGPPQAGAASHGAAFVFDPFSFHHA